MFKYFKVIQFITMENVQIIPDLTPSALKVFEFIRSRKISRLNEIMEFTGLSKRSVLYSIELLKSMGFVETQICMTDTRRRFYCFRSVK
jgi:DNA-binding MarR family transcriptional regulator